MQNQKENQKEKQNVKKPAPDQTELQHPEDQQSESQHTGKQAADKKVTGQQHSGNNDGAPVQPMKNTPDKGQQQGNKNPGTKESNADDMGSGKRQDDN